MFIDFRERGRESEREREKHLSVVSHTCPDRGLNLKTFWCMGLWCKQLNHSDRAKGLLKEGEEGEGGEEEERGGEKTEEHS